MAEPCKMGMRRPVGAHGWDARSRAITDVAAPVTPRPQGRSNGETAMDAVIKPWPKSSPAEDATLSDHVRAAPAPLGPKPSREQALAAGRTLSAAAGDNPDRDALPSHPKRVYHT